MLRSADTTLVFVDADGVVNVGVRDTPDQAPFLLCENSVEKSQGGASLAAVAISAVANQSLPHQEPGTYAKFATVQGSLDICPAMVARLGSIIRMAGPDTSVILSSSWRKPAHAKRRGALESALAKVLEEPGFGSRPGFGFDADTGPGNDDQPADRLRHIGDFIEGYATSGARAGEKRQARRLRVLVLEDFTAKPVSNWHIPPSSGGRRETCFVDNVQDAEAYLASRAKGLAGFGACDAKLVHTFDELCTRSGFRVGIGTGLTLAKTCEAHAFLEGEEQGRACELCAQQQPGPHGMMSSF